MAKPAPTTRTATTPDEHPQQQQQQAQTPTTPPTATRTTPTLVTITPPTQSHAHQQSQGAATTQTPSSSSSLPQNTHNHHQNGLTQWRRFSGYIKPKPSPGYALAFNLMSIFQLRVALKTIDAMSFRWHPTRIRPTTAWASARVARRACVLMDATVHTMSSASTSHDASRLDNVDLEKRLGVNADFHSMASFTPFRAALGDELLKRVLTCEQGHPSVVIGMVHSELGSLTEDPPTLLST